MIVGSGNSFFIGEVDAKNKLTGEVVFLYPCLSLAIVGPYENGKLISGHYRTLASASHQDYFIKLTFTETLGRPVLYDPPSCFSISRSPLETDEYEDQTVFVAASGTTCTVQDLIMSEILVSMTTSLCHPLLSAYD